MTKLNLILSSNTLECIKCDEKTAKILGITPHPPLQSQQSDSSKCQPHHVLVPVVPVHLSSLVADEDEFLRIQGLIHEILECRRMEQDDPATGYASPFRSLDLVFKAPEAPAEALKANRSPLEGVFSSPMRAFHYSGALHLSCFTHIELLEDGEHLHITAVEYSREHRSQLLRQEFGSWLLEDHIEKSVIATTVMGEIVFWNRFASELYQYPAKDVMGKIITDIIPTEMSMEQASEIMDKLGKGEHWSGFFSCFRRDGSTFMAHVTDTPILDTDSNVKFIVGISDDHTKLHNAMKTLADLNIRLEHEVEARTKQLQNLNNHLEKEVALRTKQLSAKEQHLQMIGAAINESETGVAIADIDNPYNIIWANDAVSRMLNIQSTKIIGMAPWDLPLDPETETTSLRSFFINSASQLSDDNKSATIVANVTTTDNNRSQEGLSASIHRFEVISITVQRMGQDTSSDQLNKIMITFRDLTVERTAELAQLEAERASAKNIIQMLSHELRTPLQGIMGVASTIMLDIGPEHHMLYVHVSTILASSRILLTLINNTLDSRKISANMMEKIELSSTPAIACVRSAVQYCQPFAIINEVSLQFTEDGAEFNVLANQLRFEQVTINLLGNAIKYSRPGTNVVLSVEKMKVGDFIQTIEKAPASSFKLMSLEKQEEIRKSDYKTVMVVTVSDYGKGVPETEYGKLFGEFMQLDESRNKDRNYKVGKSNFMQAQSSGSGLGLNLAMKFVTMMNGHIWFNNRRDGKMGSEFSFCIPSVPDSAGQTAKPSSKQMGEQPCVNNENHTTNPILPNNQQLCGTPRNNQLKLAPEVADKFRVLVVDDSMINVKVLTHMLKRLGIKSIHSTLSGRKALEFLQPIIECSNSNNNNCTKNGESSLPNMILTDLQMPGMDGYELIGHLRKMQSTIPNFKPVIMACSADWCAETEGKCHELGFDGLVKKPIDISYLSTVLTNTILN